MLISILSFCIGIIGVTKVLVEMFYGATVYLVFFWHQSKK